MTDREIELLFRGEFWRRFVIAACAIMSAVAFVVAMYCAVR